MKSLPPIDTNPLGSILNTDHKVPAVSISKGRTDLLNGRTATLCAFAIPKVRFIALYKS